MAIAEIDLRRDLPKVREQWDAKKLVRKACCYSAPCAVGAMLSPEVRAALLADPYEGYDWKSVGFLLDRKVLTAPAYQRGDLERLQAAFDDGDCDFDAALTTLEAKYLRAAETPTLTPDNPHE